MALLHFDGFEGTTSGTDLTNRGWTTGVGASATARTGIRSMSVGGPGSSNAVAQLPDVGVSNRHATFITGCSMRGNRLDETPGIILRDSASANIVQVQFEWGAQRVAVYTNGTLRTNVAFSGANYVFGGAFNYLEVKATIGAPGSVQVRVNGQLIAGLTWSGTITATGSQFAIAGVVSTAPTAGGATNLFDDYYLCNGAGSTYNDFLGDVRIYPLYPNGAGYSAQFTPSTGANWQTVDETSLNATDFNSSSTVGHVDSYALENAPAGVTIVRGVRLITHTRRSDAGARTAAAFIRTGGTNYEGAEFTPPTSFLGQQTFWPTNPNTGVDWTVTDVNGLEAGIIVKS